MMRFRRNDSRLHEQRYVVSSPLCPAGAAYMLLHVEITPDIDLAVLLLWIFYVFLSRVYYAFVRVCLFVSCSRLLGKD